MIDGHFVEVHGSGTPVLFIHPPQIGHVVFKYQRQLADQMQVITYDLRGHGKSEAAIDRITIKGLADDLKQIIDELQIEKVVLCGYSLGGSIAQEFAIRYPERTLGLIMSGGFPEVSTFLLARMFDAGIALTKAGKGELLARVLAKSHKVTKHDEELLFDYAMTADLKTVHDMYVAGKVYRSTERLHLITKPVSLIYGAYSHHFHPYIKLFKAKTPHAKVSFVSKTFHQVPIKRHEEFNHIIRKMIEEL